MTERTQAVAGQCVVLDAEGANERIDVFLTTNPPKKIGSVQFKPDTTLMEIAPGYENWSRQIMREAKVHSNDARFAGKKE